VSLEPAKPNRTDGPSAPPNRDLGAYDADMRDSFWMYYWPSEHDLDTLWEDAEIVLDASVLLNLHRYRADTRRELLGVLRDLSDRLWVPYQAALEYQRNRPGVILQQSEPIKSLRKAVHKARDDLMGEVGRFPSGRHPSMDRDALEGLIKKVIRRLEKYLDRSERALPDPTGRQILVEDETWEEVTSLLAGRVGNSFSGDALAVIHEDAKRRIEGRTPPGYEDSDKGEPERYGDVVLWHQMLERAKQSCQPQILVTDDRKEDWWWVVRGMTLGPRRELIVEMRDVANAGFYAYQPGRFLIHAREHLDQLISDDAIEDVTQTSQLRYRSPSMLAQALLDSFEQSQRALDAFGSSQALLDSFEQTQRALDAFGSSQALLDSLQVQGSESTGRLEASEASESADSTGFGEGAGDDSAGDASDA